jgi:hypothetical protein
MMFFNHEPRQTQRGGWGDFHEYWWGVSSVESYDVCTADVKWEKNGLCLDYGFIGEIVGISPTLPNNEQVR